MNYLLADHHRKSYLNFTDISDCVEQTLKKLSLLTNQDFVKQQVLIADEKTAKIWKNSLKSIEEHNKKDPYGSYVLKSEVPYIDVIVNHMPLSPLSFVYASAEAQGKKTKMEDAHFLKKIEQGLITGIFDGHGGKDIANYANRMFMEKFPEILLKNKDDVHQAFIQTINEIQEEIFKNPDWYSQGSTAVICFINKHTHEIYTATLGDSEANIYRKIEGELKSIPLSCVRDWSSKKDSQRRLAAIQKWPRALAKTHPLTSANPKSLRFFSLNVSRAFGDVFRRGTSETPGVIHKPKITIHQIQPDDILILACDGLKDFVNESEILEQIQKKSNENLAHQLVDFALHEADSKDNVTVVAIQVKGLQCA